MKELIFNGGLNKDLAPKFLDPKDYVGAKNIIFQTSKDGNSGVLRRYPGFDQAFPVSGTVISNNAVEIGVFENKTTRKLYFFLSEPEGEDGIYQYDLTTNTYRKILSWAGLNFNFAFLITGVAMIGDYLFWTDGLNQPRYINVTRTYANIVEADLTIIRPAPSYPLNYTIQREIIDYSPLTGNAYQFSYRYVYLDNQISVIAPSTEVIYCDFGDTDITETIYLSKRPEESIPKYVREVQLLVRRKGLDNWQIFQVVTADEFAGNASLQYLFTQFPSPYVDANTIFLVNGVEEAWEFTNGSISAVKSYATGTNFYVKNYNIEAPEVGATAPTLHIDIYRNAELWIRLQEEIIIGAEGIPYVFAAEPGNLYQIYSYSTTDGVPFVNPFSSEIPNYGFPFSGNRLGRQVAIQETVKTFESVPVKSKALEIARDRVTLGNNTEGYDLYSIPSLKATLEVLNTALETKNMPVYLRSITTLEEYYGTPQGDTIAIITERSYYLRDGDKFYYFKKGETIVNNVVAGTPTDGSTVNSEYSGAETTATVDYNIYSTAGDLTYNMIDGVQGQGYLYRTTTSAISPVTPEHIVSVDIQIPDSVGSTKFKDKSQYQIGLIFYDRYSRNQGVYTNDNCVIGIDDNFRGGIVFALKWDLSNLDRLKIPTWAESYQIARTDNLSRVSFLQGQTSDVYYAYMEADVLKYSRGYRADAEYVEIDISGSFKAGLRYVFTEGDLIDIEISDGLKTFRIIGFLGSKVRISPVSEPDFTTSAIPFPVKLYYEIWRPKEIISDLIFYETSVVYKVLNPGTADRSFSVDTGYLKGDVIVIQTDTYNYETNRNSTGGTFADNTLNPTPEVITIEAQNLDNNFDIGWVKSLGRINAVLEVGEVTKPTAVRWSNRFVQGTRINGTSNFDVNDEKQLSIEVGPIQKLQLTSKQQQEGTVMLALCNPECVSLYLGETQFVDQANRELVGATTEIIGSTNVLSGGAGTIHPESVIIHNGRVWWWDFYNSRVLRYDPNGIRDISAIGMRSDFYGRITPKTGYDPFHNLFFIGFGQNMLSFDEDFNQWRSYYDFTPGYCGKVEDFMVSFKNGIPYRSNSTTSYTYFTTEYNGEYETYLSDPNPIILDNIRINSTEVFSWANGRQTIEDLFEILITNDSGQETNLLTPDFEINESVLYAHFLRDKNSVGGILQGEVMRSDAHKIKIILKGNIGFEVVVINDTISSGH